MADVLAWVGPSLAVVTLLVALLIVVMARRSVAAVALAVFLAGWGAAGIQGRIVGALGVGQGLHLHWVFQLASAAGLLAFAVVYPNVNLTRTRMAVLAFIGIATVAGAIAIMASPDNLWFDPLTGPGIMTPIIGTTLGVVGGAFPMALLGRRWLARPSENYRVQLVWGMLPISWWVLHDGLGYTLYPWLFRGGGTPSLGHPLLDVGVWLNIAAVAFVIVLMLIALGRTIRGRGASDDRALGFVILYMLPLTLVQVVLPWSQAPGVPPAAHLLLDYAVVPLAVYGVLRHRVVDIDIKIKHGIRQSTVAATFLAVFFVAATIAQTFLEELLGWLVGGFAAGLLVFAVAPIQRMAERLSSAALPHAQNDPGYLTYRRYQIYKVALEGTLHDNVLDPSEASALRRLREELGLSLDDHRALESEARARQQALAS